MEYIWYHRDITEKQADIALNTVRSNTFLVRQSGDKLVLSKKINGWISHDIIHRSPEGYRLEGKEKVFETVPKMIAHYQQFYVDDADKQMLGSAIKREVTGMYIKEKMLIKSHNNNFIFKMFSKAAEVS